MSSKPPSWPATATWSRHARQGQEALRSDPISRGREPDDAARHRSTGVREAPTTALRHRARRPMAGRQLTGGAAVSASTTSARRAPDRATFRSQANRVVELPSMPLEDRSSFPRGRVCRLGLCGNVVGRAVHADVSAMACTARPTKSYEPVPVSAPNEANFGPGTA